MYKSIMERKDYKINDIFDEVLSSFSPVLPHTVRSPDGWSVLNSTDNLLLYKWGRDNSTIWIAAPGCSKDDITTALTSNDELSLKWNTEFSKADILVPLADKTKNVEIDVTNGLIAVTFQIQTSDVSIIMK